MGGETIEVDEAPALAPPATGAGVAALASGSPAGDDAAFADAPPELSGPQWVARFPTASTLAGLSEPFQSNCARFIDALTAAGAQVSISATRRPAERAFLMHYAFLVAMGKIDPGDVPDQDGVNIDWEHPNLNQSRAAAQKMVDGYRIVYAPALDSRHIQGRAVDMTISWSGALSIAAADGSQVTIDAAPCSGMNAHLWDLGIGYGVCKLRSDPPHWSDDGH